MDRNITLSTTEVDYKCLFESAPGLYLVLSPDLRILAASDAYLAATLKQREQVLGRPLFEVFPEAPVGKGERGIPNLRASLDHVIKSCSDHTMAVQRYDILRPDGDYEVKYWSPKNKPVFGRDGSLAYIIHRVEDVTDYVLNKGAPDHGLEPEVLKSARELEEHNATLRKMVSDGTIQLNEVNRAISDYKFALDESSIVAVTDQKGIIKNVNENFCKISKYSREELIGQDHRIINSGHHSKEYIRDLWVTIANGRIWKGELKNRAKDGTIYWVDTTIVPFLNEDKKPYQYLAIRSDITSRKEAEQQILRLNDELEDKVQERTLELTQSLEREKDANEMKSRFVSMASHEFRTPLSSILSSISLLEKYTAPEHQDKRGKHFERIRSSVRNLTGILEDFLSLDKLENGKAVVTFEVFDLAAFVESLKAEVEGMLKPGQSIRCEHVGQREVNLDKKIVHNIALNLLSNAIKYSPENKEVTVVTKVDRYATVITVKDAGIGIPEEEQKNLFKLFFRARNAALIQGTGLGLTIVKRYVELLGGEISFESKANEGTTFTVTIPKASR